MLFVCDSCEIPYIHNSFSVILLSWFGSLVCNIYSCSHSPFLTINSTKFSGALAKYPDVMKPLFIAKTSSPITAGNNTTGTCPSVVELSM